MWGAIAAAAASIIGSFVASSSSNKTNAKIASETNKTNLDLAKLQNDWNIEQWNRENEYNSYSAQRDRMLAAGINPNLNGYNNATAPQVTSADLANQQPYTVNPVIDGNTITGAYNTFQSYLNYELDKSTAQANIAKAKAETQYYNYQNERIEALMPYYQSSEYLNDVRWKTHGDALQSMNVAKLTEAQREVYDATKEDLKNMPHWQLEKLKKDFEKADSELDIIKLRSKLAKEYGIDTNASPWNTLFTMGLRDPNSYAKVIKALFHGISSSFKALLDW